MTQNCFKIYCVCILYTTLLVKYSISKENASTKVKPTYEDGYEDIFYNCNSPRKIMGITCDIVPQDGINVFNLTYDDTKYYLPAKACQGCNVSYSVLNDSDVDIDENVFEGMVALEQFRVLKSSMEVIPDFSFIKHSIKIISLESSLLTRLEGKKLQNLTMLFQMSFRNNFISFIDPDVFKGSESIEHLDLSHNLLTSIPVKLLDPMKVIRHFDASHNALLHVDNLFAITQPTNILLQFNNITDIYPILQLNKEKLTKYVHAVTEGNVENISLWRCDNGTEDLKRNFFMFRVHILDLSYNSINETLEPHFPCYRNEMYGYYFVTQILFMKGNKLRRLNRFLSHSSTNFLNFNRNQIQYVTDMDFDGVTKLQGIQFQENEIRWIDRDTFKPIRIHLQILDLSSNYITSLNGSIRYLAILRTLNCTNNLIQSFADDEFTGVYKLSVLLIKNNQIKTLGILQQQHQLQYLDIVGNDIKLIRPEQVPAALIKINLANNPFRCDCQLQPFIDRLIKDDLLLDNATLCLRPDYFEKSQKPPKCPNMCSCKCRESGGVSFMFIDCSSRNLSAVPQFNNLILMDDNETEISYYQHFYVMEQNIHPMLHIKDRVMGISLENNNLESLDTAQLPPNITQLYLSRNKLSWLPESIFKNQLNLKQISLSGNPWNCDCYALKFKQWLTYNHDVIRDINDTRCGPNSKGGSELNGKVIWTLTDFDLCPANKTLIVWLPVGILALLLTAVVLYNKYNIDIKVFLYSHGFTFVKEDLYKDKVFDAFISFSNSDKEFVRKEIIQRIESRDPNINLCMHYRNFVPGECIYDNIVRAVRSSKKTFLILSRNFINSEWCLLEFRTAHMQALQDKVHRVIVVKFGDLPDKIDPTLKAYLDGKTCLTWGEKNFWNKLFNVLPTVSHPKTIRNNEVYNCSFSKA